MYGVVQMGLGRRMGCGRTFKFILGGRFPSMIMQMQDIVESVIKGRFHVEDKVDEYVVYFEMPGAKKDTIKVYTDGWILTVSAETHKDIPSGEEYRFKVYFEEEVDPDKTTARYMDGVLIVKAPKKLGYREVKVE